MNLRFMKKSVQMLLTLVVGNILIFVPVYAQSEITAAANEAEAQTPQMLLNDLEQNERALYALFNALNSSDTNDVICSANPTENTDGNRQLCEPVFLEEIRLEVDEEIANRAKTETGFFARIRNAFQSPEKWAKRLLGEKASVPIELLQQEIESLARVHPNLLAQLNTIGEIQREYLQMVQAERRSSSYLMRQNEATYNHSGIGQSQPYVPKLTLSAPPPGYTQPTLNYGYRGPLAN
jgi:hypothetical protein